MFVKIPKGFIPDQDTDQIAGRSPRRRRALRTTRWWSTRSRSPTIVAQDPNVEALDVQRRRHHRVQLWAARITAQLVVHLKPRAQRDRAGGRDHRGACGRSSTSFPGMSVYLQNPPTIRIGGQVTKSLYQFSMQSPDKNGAVRRGRRSWRS